MNDVLPAWPLLTAFVGASLVLAVTPGPAVLYIVTRSLAQGRRCGLASVAGVALGNLGNAAAASIGLAALLAASSLAFTLVKYVGAAYLVYLGVQALRGERRSTRGAVLGAPEPLRAFRDGFLVALLNPKTAVFFAAFLPQFMPAHSASAMQAMALGGLFVAVALATDTLYALAAGTLTPLLSRARGTRTAARYLTAGALFGLGAFTAVAGSRSAR